MENREGAPVPVVNPTALETLQTMFRTLYDAVAGGANQKRLLQLIKRFEGAANSFTVLQVDQRVDLTDAIREQRHERQQKR